MEVEVGRLLVTVWEAEEEDRDTSEDVSRTALLFRDLMETQVELEYLQEDRPMCHM